MKNTPKKVFLNVGFDKRDISEEIDFKELSEVSWSTERQSEADLEYTLSSKIPSKDSVKKTALEEQLDKLEVFLSTYDEEKADLAERVLENIRAVIGVNKQPDTPHTYRDITPYE